MLELYSIFIPLCNRQTRPYRREIWQGNNSTPLLCELGALPASPLPMHGIFVPFIITSVKWDSKNCHLLGSKE